MEIKVYEMADPNIPHAAYDMAETAEQRESVACFFTSQQIWRNNIAKELDTLPHKLSWHPVSNTGTDADVCELLDIQCMCNTWELRP